MSIATELTDITFKSKQGEISLASFGLHVENQGVNTMFAMPTYSNINAVNWQEYDGEDVDFSNASLNALDLQIKVFGTLEAVNSMVGSLKSASTNSDIEVVFKIAEGTFSNKVTFSTKFVSASISKAVMEHDWRLEQFMLTDEDADFIANEIDKIITAGVDVRRMRNVAFCTITLSRYNNDANYGLLADGLRDCEGIPNERFYTGRYPVSNMPISFSRYHVADRTATKVSTFNLYNSLVFCFPLKGICQGLTQIAGMKDAFEISTEGMVGKIYETKNADKRSSKTISVPLLIRSHSITAIIQFLYNYKNYVHNTLTNGDMLYLHSDEFGDMAVYPTGCNVTKAYIKDQAWVEMTLSFNAYKYDFNFTASTDNQVSDNPEPILPPAPAPTFDPYSGITRSAWSACSFGINAPKFSGCLPYFANPDSNTNNAMPPAFGTDIIPTGFGWSTYAYYIARYPVGTLFFAVENTRTKNGVQETMYSTLLCMPFCYSLNLQKCFDIYKATCTFGGWDSNKYTLVGVVQVCDVLSKNVDNWESSLQDAPDYGGIVGTGSVRVHTSIKAMADAGKFNVASGLTLTTSDDFDLLVNNIITDFNADPAGSPYYTEQGYTDSRK